MPPRGADSPLNIVGPEGVLSAAKHSARLVSGSGTCPHMDLRPIYRPYRPMSPGLIRTGRRSRLPQFRFDSGQMAVRWRYAGPDRLSGWWRDAAYARMPRADTAGRPWRDRVTAIAEENKALYERHPWTALVSTVRPPLGPGQMAKYEHELAALDGLGLDDVEMDDCLTYLLTFVQACSRADADARAAQHDSAMNDQQWWDANAPLLARVFDEDTYPTAARVGAAAGAAHGSAYNPGHAYAFGLQRVLDALAALIEGRHH